MNKKIFPSQVKLVLWLSLVNLLIVFVRNLVVDAPLDVTWQKNLFHGFMPLVIAYLMNLFYDKLPNWLFWFLSFAWLIYYPNSPYMISDLKHVSASPLNVQDYDTLVIFSLAMLSLIYGLLSLKIMFSLFTKKVGTKFANAALVVTIALSCLGFYIGRFPPYLYSADLFTDPVKVIKQVWNSLFPISKHGATYAIMFLFGWVQFMLITMFKDINDVESPVYLTKKED